jgi:hypothetical protein
VTSDKQADANRRNALKSTGPKTPEGKDAVRLNALKHGLLSQELLLPGESEAALTELSEQMMAEWQPEGIVEALLVETIIASYWRLRRFRRVETDMLARQLYEAMREQAQSEAKSYERNDLTDVVESITTITDEKKHREALSRAQEMQAKLDAETTALGRAFMRDANEGNALSKLSRHVVPIVRDFYRALHELQRLQATRRAEGSVTPPVAVDVDVSGVSREDI